MYGTYTKLRVFVQRAGVLWTPVPSLPSRISGATSPSTPPLFSNTAFHFPRCFRNRVTYP